MAGTRSPCPNTLFGRVHRVSRSPFLRSGSSSLRSCVPVPRPLVPVIRPLLTDSSQNVEKKQVPDGHLLTYMAYITWSYKCSIETHKCMTDTLQSFMGCVAPTYRRRREGRQSMTDTLLTSTLTSTSPLTNLKSGRIMTP